MALLPFLRSTVREEMLTLTKSELAVLDEAQPEYEIYIVETRKGSARWWMMKVKLPSQEKIYFVQTALGRTKLWKNLDIAVDFVQETCPRTQLVRVVFAEEGSLEIEEGD
jgi:hypothetical protein